MGLRINTNTSSLIAQKNLKGTKGALDTALQRLASGSRINQASDDAAGLAISENLKAQIRGMKQAKRNAQDGISLFQVAEGGITEISNMLIRLRELAMQSASDTVGDKERSFTNKEFQSIKEEIQRITDVTEFNGTKLLNGQMGQVEMQIGVHNNPLLDRIIVDGKSNDTSLMALQITEDQVSNKLGAQSALEKIDFALNYVNGMRANLGAVTNRLQSTINSITQNEETVTAANSRIRDADIAEESSELTRNNILMQSGVSVLSQANANNQMALKLLG